MKLHLLELLMVLLFTSCAIEKPCTLKLEQAPELRGLRLGMSNDEVKKLYSNFPVFRTSELNPVKFGKDIIRFDGSELNQHSELKDIQSMVVTFVDSKAAKITIFYLNTLNWKTADEFAKKIGQALKLDGTWKKVGEDNSSAMRVTNCNGFAVWAGFMSDYKSTGGSGDYLPYVEMVNYSEDFKSDMRRLDAEKQANQKKEEQKEVFQP